AIGEHGFESIRIGFDDLFTVAIVIFLLEMGIVAGQRLDDIKQVGIFLVIFSILIPTFNGIIGVLVATALGLSLGGAVMFGLLMASASFIAAPAVLRHAIPQAKPSLYITSALGITFPYNIIILLPIMFAISSFVHDIDGSINFFNYLGIDI
ncbi:MAG: sodium-dependent bicarbonate transport family permease, partial [Nitrosarchaeum sp.]